MSFNSRKTILKRLRRGKRYRVQFVESHLSKTVAYQIRATRDRLGWSQSDLAARAGMTQNGISRLESPDYGKFTISTLKKLAAALDVALIVRLIPFSELADWVSETPRVNSGLTAQSLAVADFQSEEAAGVFDSSLRPLPTSHDEGSLYVRPHWMTGQEGESVVCGTPTFDPLSMAGQNQEYQRVMGGQTFIRPESQGLLIQGSNPQRLRHNGN